MYSSIKATLTDNVARRGFGRAVWKGTETFPECPSPPPHHFRAFTDIEPVDRSILVHKKKNAPEMRIMTSPEKSATRGRCV